MEEVGGRRELKSKPPTLFSVFSTNQPALDAPPLPRLSNDFCAEIRRWRVGETPVRGREGVGDERGKEKRKGAGRA